jgi:anti-sigma B factor antagonist
MIDLKVGTEQFSDGTCVISVTGELDMYTSSRFEEQLLDAVEEGPPGVIVDLSGCEFIDSTALGILITANRRLGYPAKRLSLVVSDRNILKTFEMTGLDRVFAIEATLAAAANGGTPG